MSVKSELVCVVCAHYIHTSDQRYHLLKNDTRIVQLTNHAGYVTHNTLPNMELKGAGEFLKTNMSRECKEISVVTTGKLTFETICPCTNSPVITLLHHHNNMDGGHTHTHTHTRARTRTHTHTHTCTHTQ